MWHPTFYATMGEHFEWNGLPDPDGAMVPMDPQPTGPLDAIDSGEDWWYAHTNIYENGEYAGTMAAGYAGWKNFEFLDDEASGCFGFSYKDPPDPDELESVGARKGGIVQAIARFDKEGSMVWCKQLLIGTFYSIIQTPDGGFLAVGEAQSNRKLGIHLASYPGPIRYDPGQGAGPDISTFDCSDGLGAMGRKVCATKFDGTGAIEWINLYAWDPDHTIEWQRSGRGFGVANILIDGDPGYYIIGEGEAFSFSGAIAWRLMANGDVHDRHLFSATSTVFPAELGLVTDDQVSLYDVECIQVNGVQKLALAGRVRPQFGAPQSAVLVYFDDLDAAPWSSSFTKHTLLAEIGEFHDPGLIQHCSGFGFANDNGDARLVWPVLSDYIGDVFGGSRKSAILNVHCYDLSGSLKWTTGLGEVRAYDLQSDLTATSDNGVAVVSSKWARVNGHEQYNRQNPFRYDDLSDAQKACLGPDGLFGSYGWDDPGQDIYEWWNTNCYVAKLDMSNGAVRWETDLDADERTPPSCYPLDTRDQECMYKITETPDGGLVVSGNTSHNLDDGYLAKLHPDCQSYADYSAFTDLFGYDPGSFFVHTVHPGETWNTDMNVHGIVRIPPGVTLTVTANAVIRFADTELLDHPTRIEIQAGGELVVNSGAELTNLPVCPGAMWDGILVQGDPHESQEGVNHEGQGRLNLRDATVSNARTGVITANAYPASYSMADVAAVASGGIVIADRSTFLDCRRDVVLAPYENFDPRRSEHPLLSNKSRFYRSHFIVDAALNDNSTPQDHILLYGVRTIPMLGCDLQGEPLASTEYPVHNDIGTGIRSINSSFTVDDHCAYAYYTGQPCPEEFATHSSFDQLRSGVVASAIIEGYTFSVDAATFTRCPSGIRMEGIRDAAITRNHFHVPDFSNPMALGTPYGVYSDECTGYEIEDNVLTGNTLTDNAQAGFVIKSSGPEANRIYNNQFDGFGYRNSTALLIQGQNANPTDDYLTGLDIKCNDFGQTGNKNAYDVALTAGEPTVRGTQGASSFADDYTAPAGNRFSLLGATESDWHVANSSNFVVYYHHEGTFEPWVPQDFDGVYFDPDASLVNPPTNWSQACPSNQRSRDRERSGMMAGSQDKSVELDDRKAAYDATLDNGDTYSLLSYVNDPTKSSTQVRNALQSVAPNVGVEVWQAAFDRSPVMNQWNLTQALLSNSPLQPEVMKLCYESDLSDFYYNLVASAQAGINPLDVLESEISTFASGKAQDLTDLGRWSWLDSTNVDSVIFLLKNWHDLLPADNGDAVLAGYYSAKGDHAALYDLAAALELASATPGAYGVLKRYAHAEQVDGWTRPDAATSTYLSGLAQDRWMIGSARAGAWLNALGEEPLEEVVILPLEERTTEARKRVRSSSSPEALILEAYPNPTDGLAYVVCNVPEGVEQATVHVHDLTGRLVAEQRISTGSVIVELDLSAEPVGVYAAALALDGVRTGTVKLTVH